MKRTLKALSDTELENTLLQACKDEVESLIRLLHCLAELEERDYLLKAGFQSLFDYCRRRLGYSESGANRRIRAARALRDYPQIEELLRDRKLSLSTLSAVAGILTKENCSQVLLEVCGRSHRAVEAFIESLKPRRRLREAVKPVWLEKQGSKAHTLLPQQQVHIPETPQHSTANVGGKNCSENMELRHQYRFSGSCDFQEKLEEAKSLLSNACPEGVTLEIVFEACLECFLDKHSPKRREKRRNGRKANAGRRTERRASNGRRRHIPKAVQDQVMLRDGRACTYVGSDGVRCGSKHKLQIDHIMPVALGGSNDLSNLRILCAAHNMLSAREVFPGKVPRKISRAA